MTLRAADHLKCILVSKTRYITFQEPKQFKNMMEEQVLTIFEQVTKE